MRRLVFSRVRNRRELNASLKGTTLGDTDGDVDDTLKWVKKSKKKEKELARKRQEELENMDKVFQGEEYTESRSLYFSPSHRPDLPSPVEDLVGLKVSHDFDEMDEGEARILTLKDSRILDNEGESLLSPNRRLLSKDNQQRMSYRMSRWRRRSVIRRISS